MKNIKLTQSEIRGIITPLVKLFRDRFNSKEKSICNKELINLIFIETNKKFNEVDIRYFISHIRKNDLLSEKDNNRWLCATSSGYFSTTNVNDMLKHFNSCRNRANEEFKTASHCSRIINRIQSKKQLLIF